MSVPLASRLTGLPGHCCARSHGRHSPCKVMPYTIWSRRVAWLQEVFLAHVRLGNVLEQQQVAMKISKAMPGEMQTFWVVCSMLAQVTRARAGAAVSQMQPEMLLKLAAALAAKQLKAAGALTYEALLAYMDVLQAQGDLQRCSELLEGPSGAAVQMPHELARLKVCSCIHTSGPAMQIRGDCSHMDVAAYRHYSTRF